MSNNNSGGGKSSLGYLFGLEKLGQQQNDHQSKVSSSPICLPPYGTDDMEKSPEKVLLSLHPIKKDDPISPKQYVVYHGDHKSSDFLVTGRPSTKVKSVPGGDSSLGYLFGNKG
ncbi:protein SPIRAL1-like 5 [Rutidosis leptorrhynchoides]|uniref:protein SPIRAL1-like 5 n=1 Tax=Rutidosis leptorrhynchoides TaxID=125765 RepID=UPI003A9937DA